MRGAGAWRQTAETRRAMQIATHRRTPAASPPARLWSSTLRRDSAAARRGSRAYAKIAARAPPGGALLPGVLARGTRERPRALARHATTGHGLVCDGRISGLYCCHVDHRERSNAGTGGSQGEASRLGELLQQACIVENTCLAQQMITRSDMVLTVLLRVPRLDAALLQVLFSTQNGRRPNPSTQNRYDRDGSHGDVRICVVRC